MIFPHTLVRWDADAIAAWERAAPTSTDDPRARVALLGPAVEAASAVEIIPSWGAETPTDTWVEVQLIVEVAGAARTFRIAAWDAAPTGSRRTSFDGQDGPAGRLATDTLILTSPAATVQARVLLCAEPGADMPELTSLALALTAPVQQPTLDAPLADGAAALPSSLIPHPSSLSMPLLISQYLNDPVEGHRWCSPTALTMLLAYWREHAPDTRLAPYARAEAVLSHAVPLVYDPGWEGTGNWAFNTALAASLGLAAYVTRLHSLAQLARWTAAGVPVPISIRWEQGELDGALGRSAGHITIVTGFAGDRVLMAEPAARDMATIARSYRADQLLACWQRAALGAVYLIHPIGWPTPQPGEGDAWA